MSNTSYIIDEFRDVDNNENITFLSRRVPPSQKKIR